MKDDKLLKELLHKWAVEETSADFTQHIMQRIEANAVAKQAVPSLLKNKLFRVLAGIFMLVCILLIALCITSQPVAFPFSINVEISPVYISQITSFLIVFWVVLLLNQWYEKRRNIQF